MAVPMEIPWKLVTSTQNNIHKAESHSTNYSLNFTSDWANLGPLLFLMNIAVSSYSSAKLAYVPAGTSFWTYVHWDYFAHLSEYYTP
jgi:hypothetical protein